MPGGKSISISKFDDEEGEGSKEDGGGRMVALSISLEGSRLAIKSISFTSPAVVGREEGMPGGKSIFISKFDEEEEERGRVVVALGIIFICLLRGCWLICKLEVCSCMGIAAVTGRGGGGSMLSPILSSFMLALSFHCCKLILG